MPNKREPRRRIPRDNVAPAAGREQNQPDGPSKLAFFRERPRGQFRHSGLCVPPSIPSIRSARGILQFGTLGGHVSRALRRRRAYPQCDNERSR